MFVKRPRIVSCAIALAGTLFIAVPAAAQASFCFRGRPIAKCGAFALFELTATRRLVGTRHFEGASLPPNFQFPVEDLPTYLSWDLGAMVNRDSANAIGGMLELGVSDPGWRVAIKARHRTWYSDEASLDLAAGALVVQERTTNGLRAHGYGITAGTALGGGDIFALTLDGDVVKLPTGRPRAAIHGGIRLGSYAALGATALLLVGVTAIALGLSHNDF